MRRTKLLTVFAVLLIWSAAAAFADRNVLPGPVETLLACIEMSTPEQFINVSVSMLRLVFAYVISLGVALFFALLSMKNLTVRTVVSDIMSALIKIPNIAYVTYFMLFIGIGTASVVSTVAVSVVPVITLSVLGVLDKLDKNVHIVSDIYKVPFLRRVRYFFIPGIFEAFHPIYLMSISMSFKTLVMAEFIAGMSGLGYGLVEQKETFQMQNVLAYIIIIVIVGILIQKILEILYFRAKIVLRRI